MCIPFWEAEKGLVIAYMRLQAVATLMRGTKLGATIWGSKMGYGGILEEKWNITSSSWQFPATGLITSWVHLALTQNCQEYDHMLSRQLNMSRVFWTIGRIDDSVSMMDRGILTSSGEYGWLRDSTLDFSMRNVLKNSVPVPAGKFFLSCFSQSI